MKMFVSKPNTIDIFCMQKRQVLLFYNKTQCYVSQYWKQKYFYQTLYKQTNINTHFIHAQQKRKPERTPQTNLKSPAAKTMPKLTVMFRVCVICVVEDDFKVCLCIYQKRDIFQTLLFQFKQIYIEYTWEDYYRNDTWHDYLQRHNNSILLLFQSAYARKSY